jgi:hypothetical protein
MVRAGGELPDIVMAWLFAGGVATHVLLVAGLKNPTVRKRYVAVRALLDEYGRLDFYEELLALIGADRLSREVVGDLLERLIILFDTAKTIAAESSLFFSADISDDGRAIAIDGSRELIERGDHREAVFWIVATYCRCMMILRTTHPKTEFEEDFRGVLATLGIESPQALQHGADEIERFLPRVWAMAEYIMRKNPDIEGGEGAQG